MANINQSITQGIRGPTNVEDSIINNVVGLQTNPQGVRIYEVVDTSPRLATAQTTAPEIQGASNTTATTATDVSSNKNVKSKTPTTVTAQLFCFVCYVYSTEEYQHYCRLYCPLNKFV